jgi:catechol 2,3-dioxygenase-like lactoylglutathione lyase family enzyme
LKIERIDHLVLTVSDIERTCEFYSRVLGMQTVVFDEGRRALAFGGQKINLHQAGEEFEPHAAHPTPGSADLCFITDVPTDEVLRELESHGIGMVRGPVERTGALGPMESVYLRDPDGNLIEVSNYPG